MLQYYKKTTITDKNYRHTISQIFKILRVEKGLDTWIDYLSRPTEPKMTRPTEGKSGWVINQSKGGQAQSIQYTTCARKRFGLAHFPNLTCGSFWNCEGIFVIPVKGRQKPEWRPGRENWKKKKNQRIQEIQRWKGLDEWTVLAVERTEEGERERDMHNYNASLPTYCQAFSWKLTLRAPRSLSWPERWKQTIS